MNQLKQEMIEQCRSAYANNKKALSKIAEFENDCTIGKCNSLLEHKTEERRQECTYILNL